MRNVVGAFSFVVVVSGFAGLGFYINFRPGREAADSIVGSLVTAGLSARIGHELAPIGPNSAAGAMNVDLPRLAECREATRRYEEWSAEGHILVAKRHKKDRQSRNAGFLGI